jgi:hypothetical protein
MGWWHHRYRPVSYRYYHRPYRPYCRVFFSWRHGGWIRTCGWGPRYY